MTPEEKKAYEKKGYDSLDACLYLTQEVLAKMIRTGSNPAVLREYLEQRIKGIILEIEVEEYEKAVAEEVKDCTTCKYGKYNDHLEKPFCYNPEKCEGWERWEAEEP